MNDGPNTNPKNHNIFSVHPFLIIAAFSRDHDLSRCTVTHVELTNDQQSDERTGGADAGKIVQNENVSKSNGKPKAVGAGGYLWGASKYAQVSCER
ncbi:hypothetical protein DAPPUDRAFT_239402 [Daphnia pulex]|uniref:Uncharacterized protein n=1 Tax=Daphnia pulex TaxID=6669 RepID=E9G978_DAPPU|nr:hypothetical protein DAPPUDRAFT_239402 [Daphnia pulex]|eukprot:EFX84135.1 hypothetical protein DAPPUDRAFT_239402 [Daphnia pulex]